LKTGVQDSTPGIANETRGVDDSTPSIANVTMVVDNNASTSATVIEREKPKKPEMYV